MIQALTAPERVQALLERCIESAAAYANGFVPLPPLRPLARGTLLALVAVKLAIHLPLLGRYGYFRDELYFLDCGRHLSWGYVDLAPLFAWVSRVMLELGGSLHLLRLVSAVAGAALVALTMLLAQRFGGGRFAQALAGIAVIVAPESRMKFSGGESATDAGTRITPANG